MPKSYTANRERIEENTNLDVRKEQREFGKLKIRTRGLVTARLMALLFGQANTSFCPETLKYRLCRCCNKTKEK